MKTNSADNYLDYIYLHNPDLVWKVAEDGEVILERENKGAFNRVAQLLLQKPKVSYIHMEELGSFIWPLIDGNRSIYEIGQKVSEQFGEKAEPLYERISVYFRQLDQFGFIVRK